MSEAAAPPSEGALAWLETFTECWRPPARERWLERYQDVFHPGVRLIQPLSPRAEGHEGTRTWFDSVFGLIPDLHADVEGWSASGDTIHIDIRLRGTLGGRPIVWRAHDRCVVTEDGRLLERESYFDSLPLVLALAARPKAWPAVVRSGSSSQLIRSITTRGGKR